MLGAGILEVAIINPSLLLSPRVLLAAQGERPDVCMLMRWGRGGGGVVDSSQQVVGCGRGFLQKGYGISLPHHHFAPFFALEAKQGAAGGGGGGGGGVKQKGYDLPLPHHQEFHSYPPFVPTHGKGWGGGGGLVHWGYIVPASGWLRLLSISH